MKFHKLILGCLLALPLTMLASAKQNIPADQMKAYEIVKKMVNKVGDYQSLRSKKDVVYSYTYIAADGKYDQSVEKYIFDGELSYGQYLTHQRTFIDLPGIIEQGYDGSEFWLKHDGQVINNQKRLQRVVFNRPTNYYWFTMMQKLMDPGLEYEYVGETSMADQNYDIVKISFEPQANKASDVYQLYVNRETSLVDQFVFTVAEFNVVEEPYLMQVSYEKIEGLYIPTERKYKKSNWDAVVTNEPWRQVKWTNIQFNNNLKKKDFKKEHQIKIMDNRSSTTSLKSKLDERKSSFSMKASDYKKKIYADGIQDVADSGILQSAVNIGDIAPDFTLVNAAGKMISLEDKLREGPVVLTWYRGGWCPYCNLTLRALQDELPNFEAQGASLIALSPELPDNSLTTAEKNDLKFEVLSDKGNEVARSYGIVFKLIEPVADSYNKSFNLVKFNGDESDELPLAASYVINTNGQVIYAFLDADYRNRAEPGELTKALKKI